MARKTKIVTIETEGRDKGRTYFLTEMPPRQAEKWAARALLAFAKTGHTEMSDDFRETLQHTGMAGLAAIGIRAITSVDFEDAEPLMDEMMSCVMFVPDPSKVDQVTKQPIVRPLIEDDVDEVSTLLLLRSEVMELHLGFSIAGFLSRLGTVAREKLASNSNIMSTSPSQSELSSEED